MLPFFLLALGFGAENTPAQESATVGLNIGQKMPAFHTSDQNGHDVSSASLKGANGTVLLFFRSADW